VNVTDEHGNTISLRLDPNETTAFADTVDAISSVALSGLAVGGVELTGGGTATAGGVGSVGAAPVVAAVGIGAAIVDEAPDKVHAGLGALAEEGRYVTRIDPISGGFEALKSGWYSRCLRGFPVQMSDAD